MTPVITSFKTNSSILFILFILPILFPGVLGETITVCSSGCNSTIIQAGINIANVGDTISVLSGSYVENIIINKSIILQGAGHGTNGTTLTSTNNGQAVTITSGGSSAINRLIIRNLTIANSTGNNSIHPFLSGTAIDIVSNSPISYITIDDVMFIDNIDGWGVALRVNHSSGINDLVINNSIFLRGSTGIGQPPYNGSEDNFSGTTKVNNFAIINTSISLYNGRGLYGYWLFSNMTISSSSFINNSGHGAHFRWIEGLVIQDSIFHNNGLSGADDEPEWPNENSGVKFECRAAGFDRPENQPCKDILIQRSNFTSNGIGVLSEPDEETVGTGENIGNGILFFSEMVNVSNVTIENSIFNNNVHNGIYVYGNNSNIAATIINSTIQGNGERGISTIIPIPNFIGNVSGAIVFAKNNYWGTKTGPARIGRGSGNNASINVTFSPWYTSSSKTEKLYQEVLATSLDLDFNDIKKQNVNNVSVTSQLSLIKIGENNTGINWVTNNSAVITNKGRITRQDQNTTVLLTAIVRGIYSVNLQKNITIVVKAKNITDLQAVSNARTNLTFDQIKLNNINEINITDNLNLPLTGINDTIISWSTNNTNVIDIGGSAFRKQTNKSVTLTATISAGSSIDTKTFNLTVAGTSDSDKLNLSDAKLDLTDLMILNGNLAKNDIRADLYLPNNLSDHPNVSISWNSSNANINISNTRGIIIRNESSDINVILTATLNKSSKTEQKRFLLTINLGEPIGIYDNTGKATVYDDTTEIIINSTNLNNITLIEVPQDISSNQSVFLNLGHLVDFNNGKLTTGTNNLTLLRSTASANYTAEITANTEITGDNSWNGLITIPTIDNSGQYSISSGSVDIVIEIGAGTELNLSNPAKIILGGMTGKSAAFARTGTSLTEITTECNSASNSSNIIGNNECYFDDGTDLLIWTYHFTKFAAFTITTIPNPSGGGGGSGIAVTREYEPSKEIIKRYTKGGSSKQTEEELDSQESKKEEKLEEKPKEENPNKVRGVLFDINLDLSKKAIDIGKNLLATIGLLNIGEPGRIDVELHYDIRNDIGEIIYKEVEIILVETQTEFIKNIDTTKLEKGEYTLTTNLIYEGQKEPAIAQKVFTIVSRAPYSLIYQILLAMLITISIPGSHILYKTFKEDDEEENDPLEEIEKELRHHFVIEDANNYFHLSNGKYLKSVQDLKEYLKVMPEEVFGEYVGEDFNHFADWVQRVFNATTVAQAIRTCKSKEEMLKIL